MMGRTLQWLYRTSKWRCSGFRFGLLGAILTVGCIFSFYTKTYYSGREEQYKLHRKLLPDENEIDRSSETKLSWRTRVLLMANQTEIGTFNPVTLAATPAPRGIYPANTFSYEQLRQGAVVLHCIGLVYMFVALAIVCDEFFVPSLGVIIDKFQISDDVAGATFMAAGGSAPELFTSLFGVFLAGSDVGIGTIVGSAVFNILFVIGMCAIFSKTLLSLTWWPLFRDVVFYCCSLIMLLIFFRDAKIEWWEALILLSWYFAYVLFMKFNLQVERCVKSRLNRTIAISVAQTPKETPLPRNRRHSVPHFRNTNMFRHGALQLMLHTIDPLSETVIHEKAVQMRAIAKPTNEMQSPSKVTPINTNGTANGHTQLDNSHTHLDNGASFSPQPEQQLPDQTSSSRECIISAEHLSDDVEGNRDHIQTIMHPNMPEENSVAVLSNRTTSTDMATQSTLVEDTSQSPSQDIPDTDVEEPLDMSWPPTLRKRITYILLAPLVIPLWLTLPDVRREEKRRYFPVTFLGSIMWIGIFSYLMLWWASVIGQTVGIEDQVMGLTFLAAGTSIPDLITSVIVARKGLGDMAVSSSVGSNIFDITVGLPLPWLIWTLSHLPLPVTVNSKGLFCSILLLFGMLIMVIISIAAFRWHMTKALGISMFVLYIIFITISLLMELGFIPCLLGGA